MILLCLAIGWLAGAALAALGWASWWPVVGLGAGALVVGWTVMGQSGRAMLLALAVLAGVASLQRYESALPQGEPQGVAAYNGSTPVRLLGTIVSEPEPRLASQRFVVNAAFVEVDGAWVETSGRVLVTQRQYPRFHYGDRVDMTAALDAPPVFETFDYREYLARRGIFSAALFPSMTVFDSGGGTALKRRHVSLRAPLGEALNRALPEPEASLARGLLLGQRASIPADVNEAFNASGLSHLIAISGYNVMLVAGAVIGVVTPLAGRRRATVAAMAVVVLYAGFVGAEPPVMRAMVMALVMLGASLAGRPGSALTGVALAGAVLVLASPRIIEDVSFQLSFAATLGIIVAATPLRERLLAALTGRVPGGAAVFVAEQAAVTTSASVAVLPIMAASFGRLSLVSLPANLLAAPVFAYALLGAGLTAVAGAIDTTMGRFVGEAGYLPIHYLVVLADISSQAPLATVSVGEFGVAHAAAAYGVIAATLVALARTRPALGEPLRGFSLKPAPALALVSVAAAGFVWWGALQPAEANLRVSVLDVGQGDSILVESPSGSRVLIDGGPSGARVTQAMSRVLGPSERRIDLMVLTHAQDDHVTGLVEVLERYDVGAVLWNGHAGETGAFRAWWEAVSAKGVAIALAEAGQIIDLGAGAYMEVLHPQAKRLEGTEDDLNNNSVVLRLVYRSVSFLLTGDIEADAEVAILEAGHDVSATVLKVAHHGSDGATTEPFLDAVSPSLAVLSAGAGNVFGHPSPGLRLRLAGVPLLRTDHNGTVKFETDGTRVWLAYERGEVSVVEVGLRP